MSEKPVDNMNCLDISLKAVDSTLRISDRRDIPFARAVLKIRNICDSEVLNVEPRATLGQERGTVQEVTSSFSQKAHASIPPGGTVIWDLYDDIIPAHPGISSKVHLFGYRAVLNWRFDLVAWAEYQPAGSSESVRTSASRWALLWTVPEPATGKVELSIEEIKD
ncbi:MAG TPA: hypothetical protein VK448_07675 [Dissulfurispiraceae bacterium]|nr:hypothetical protein [Dissulfurispiraceae bacterium]